MIRTLCALALAILAALPAAAQSVSPWSGDERAAIRLVAGPVVAGVVEAGVDIRLDKGWKTYWKEPGDSGVPPRFDWSASENVAAVEVLFPAPRRLDDGAGTAIGYDRSLLLPLRVTPRDAGRPVRLRLAMDYAVCEKLCVPLQGEAVLDLGVGRELDRFAAAAISRARHAVPVPAVAGGDGPLSLRVAARPDGAVEAAVRAEGASEVDLFADGGGLLSASLLPRAAGRDAEGRHLFRLDVPAGRARTLKLVAVADGRAIEVDVALDAGAATP